MPKTTLKPKAPPRRRDQRPAATREHVADLADQLAFDRTLSVAQARAQFADLLNQVRYRKDRVVLTRHGKGIVALIPAEDLEDLEALEDRIDGQLLDRAAKEGEEALVPWKSIKRDARRRR